MSKSKILVVGCCRNVEKTIKREIYRIYHEFCSTCQLSFYIVESDSTDQTKLCLDALSKNTCLNFHFKSLGNLSSKIPNRVERITYCRNQYVEYFNSRSDCDYVMVVDLDQRNSALNSKILFELKERNVSGIFCSQFFLYDIYALLELKSDITNCWQSIFKDKRFQKSPLKLYRKYILDRMVHLKRGDVLEVRSYFGGVALYTADAFRIGGRYTSKIDKHTCCEHLPFNKKISDSGKRLIVMGSCKNFYFNKHLIPKLLNVFGLDFLLIRRLKNKALSFDE